MTAMRVELVTGICRPVSIETLPQFRNPLLQGKVTAPSSEGSE